MKRAFPSLMMVLAVHPHASGQVAPVLTWINNSSVKLEQIIGDYDWEAKAQGSNLLTASQTETRFQILANGEGYSFEDNGKLIFLFGDTVSGIPKLEYDAADPLAWCTNTDGESPLILNFFTNVSANGSQFIPIFVQPPGFEMGGNDVPNAGISLSSGVFLVCNTGSDGQLTQGDSADVVTFDETTLPLSSSGSFHTNRVISVLDSSLPPNSVLQGHFNVCSLHEFGTSVLMYGAGEYRAGDVFLSMTPTATFATGEGALYFAGITNGLPVWSIYQSNCVPVVQDNPTDGLPWPATPGTVGNMSVIYSTHLNLWLMTYDGGRVTDATTGVYFTYASQPWGPWATPQLIFNKRRDHGSGIFIHEPVSVLGYDDGLDGPTINPSQNDPTNTPGGDFAPNMIERFTRITNATLYIYYTMSTWNPYTVVKMRSAFTFTPTIDPSSFGYDPDKGFKFSWTAPTNEIFEVQFSDVLPATNWVTFSNIVTSTNGVFRFADKGIVSGGLGSKKFYRVRTPQ